MKRAILFIFLGLFAISMFAATRMTVDQLDKEIAASKGERDNKIAGRLSTMELTERLSGSKLAAMEAALPGPESRQALVMLADQAEFLDPPAAEIPKDAAPSFSEQRAMIAATIEYVRMLEHRLPNLFATRNTIHFEDNPPGLKLKSMGKFNPAQPLHPVSRTEETVLYRDGKDLIRIGGKEQPATTQTMKGLSSVGEFGPILANVLIDLPQGKLAWNRWEQRSGKRIAVFGFSVPKSASHYAVRFCCVGMRPFEQFSGYHGEMTINPVDGTILRLTIMADLAKDDPISKADLMVEYLPVDLGGRSYFCPTKSIAVSLAMDQAVSRGAMDTGEGTVNYQALAIAEAPKQLMINEIVFEHYHLFASESRVLTAENSEPPSTLDEPNALAATQESVPASSDNPVNAAVSGTANIETAKSEIPVAPGVAATTPTVTDTAESAREISVTPLQTPSIPDLAPNEAKFSLRVTTRNVEISVAAFDKKGHPVTDLKPEDFQILDGGRKQTLRSFGRAGFSSTVQQASAAAAQRTEYSNRAHPTDIDTALANKPTTENSTIIFFDSTSLKFDDLTNARQQVLKILGTLPASERVGLYVRIGFGFRVLLEATTDRATLNAALSGWKPDARDLARAQEAEARNRQEFDTLAKPGAVLSTYALVGGGGGGGPMIGSDPKLFNLGEEPTREALLVLVAVAAHMGAIPGHKNLAWIASDNVLADWSDQSASGDEGRMSPNSIGAFSVRTQEALNNAHVSLYAFDASQLGTAATDASLQNAGVALDPSDSVDPNFKAPPGGRSFTQLRTQTHPVQIALQQLAESTGGRAFGRSSNVVANLNRVIEDSNAIYELSFAPDTQPDGKYHQLKVSLPSRRDITLRYRTGYLFSKEPATLKERFAQVLWQPFDVGDIAITARRVPATGGVAVSLNVATNDLGLTRQGDHWIGKLDVFMIQRDDSGIGALVKEQTLALELSRATHDKFLRDGIPSEQYLDEKQSSESVRFIVVDENSGRIGSITLPPVSRERQP